MWQGDERARGAKDEEGRAERSKALAIGGTPRGDERSQGREIQQKTQGD